MSSIKGIYLLFYIIALFDHRTRLWTYSGFGWYKTILALYTEIRQTTKLKNALSKA